MRFVIAACGFVLFLTLNLSFDDATQGDSAVATSYHPKSMSQQLSGSAHSAEALDMSEIASAAPDDPPLTLDDSAPAREPTMDEVCVALADAAAANDIPVPFLARLIWQESRFRSRVVSSAGAQGMAQFMPKTAEEFGLSDPFDPLKALPASARFLRRLYDQFGNLGLAAAAYNAGSGRIQNWLARRQSLPLETRNYVRIITGESPENWTVAAQTASLHLHLPREAPCEGVGGLSREKEVASVAVTLSPSANEIVTKARLEAMRVAAAASKKRSGKKAASTRSGTAKTRLAALKAAGPKVLEAKAEMKSGKSKLRRRDVS